MIKKDSRKKYKERNINSNSITNCNRNSMRKKKKRIAIEHNEKNRVNLIDKNFSIRNSTRRKKIENNSLNEFNR